MAKIKHNNRQARRSRKALQSALLELLCNKTYNKITISDITRKADLARPTFYAHYETKDHLLTSIIDGFLEQFFGILNSRDPGTKDDSRDKKINISLFNIAKESNDVVCLLKTLDVDSLFLRRFRHFWREFTKNNIQAFYQQQDPRYYEYINEFLAFSIYGILKKWIENGMNFEPEVMGHLLYNLTGPPVLETARTEFHKMVKDI